MKHEQSMIVSLLSDANTGHQRTNLWCAASLPSQCFDKPAVFRWKRQYNADVRRLLVLSYGLVNDN